MANHSVGAVQFEAIGSSGDGATRSDAEIRHALEGDALGRRAPGSMRVLKAMCRGYESDHDADGQSEADAVSRIHRFTLVREGLRRLLRTVVGRKVAGGLGGLRTRKGHALYNVILR